MSDVYELSQWIKARDEALYTFDVDTFKEFYRKWQKRGLYTEPLPSDEVIEITMWLQGQMRIYGKLLNAIEESEVEE